MIWLKTDPRHHFNKHGKIIVAKPSLLGNSIFDIGIGQVETKHGWNVWISFSSIKQYIHENDKWDVDWKWIPWPLDEEVKVK